MSDSPGFLDVDQRALDRVQQFLRFNQMSVLVAIACAAVAYVVWVDSWILIAVVVYESALYVVLGWGRRRLTADNLDSVGVWLMIANWCTAVVLTLAAPFTYILGVLQVLAPIIAAGPVLARKGLVRTVLGGVVVASGVTAIGFAFSDSEISQAIPHEIVIGGVALMSVPVAIGAFDANERQAAALRRALRDNALIRDSRSRLVRAADDERRRLERNLHDGAQQQLVAVAMELRLLKSSSGMAESIDPLVGELEDALENLRELAHGIYPPLLRSRGLGEALAAAGRRSPLAVAVDAAVPRQTEEVEAAIYFCCLEALQNATKHAGPGATVQIAITAADGRLRGYVADDGPGFATAHLEGLVADPTSVAGEGLRNMVDRIGAVGGDVRISGDDGARIEFTIPASPLEPADR